MSPEQTQVSPERRSIFHELAAEHRAKGMSRPTREEKLQAIQMATKHGDRLLSPHETSYTYYQLEQLAIEYDRLTSEQKATHPLTQMSQTLTFLSYGWSTASAKEAEFVATFLSAGIRYRSGFGFDVETDAKQFRRILNNMDAHLSQETVRILIQALVNCQTLIEPTVAQELVPYAGLYDTAPPNNILTLLVALQDRDAKPLPDGLQATISHLTKVASAVCHDIHLPDRAQLAGYPRTATAIPAEALRLTPQAVSKILMLELEKYEQASHRPHGHRETSDFLRQTALAIAIIIERYDFTNDQIASLIQTLGARGKTLLGLANFLANTEISLGNYTKMPKGDPIDPYSRDTVRKPSYDYERHLIEFLKQQIIAQISTGKVEIHFNVLTASIDPPTIGHRLSLLMAHHHLPPNSHLLCLPGVEVHHKRDVKPLRDRLASLLTLLKGQRDVGVPVFVSCAIQPPYDSVDNVAQRLARVMQNLAEACDKLITTLDLPKVPVSITLTRIVGADEIVPDKGTAITGSYPITTAGREALQRLQHAIIARSGDWATLAFGGAEKIHEAFPQGTTVVFAPARVTGSRHVKGQHPGWRRMVTPAQLAHASFVWVKDD